MSQQRYRSKNRNTSQMTFRKSNAADKEPVNNQLFEETFPDESIKVSPVVKLAASIHVAIVNVLFLIGQYIIIFGNIWRHETRLFGVLALCLIYKPTQQLTSLLLWKCRDSIRWYAKVLITIVHVLCCTIFPNFRYDTIWEFITSFWIIFVVVFSTFRKDNEFDPSKSFRSNILSIIGSNVIITCAYTLCYLTKSLFAFSNLFSVFLLIVLAQVVLSIQVVIFNSEVYAPIVKCQGCWVRASKSLQMTIQGHIEEYNPDRRYSFGTPVISDNTVYISGGFITSISPQDLIKPVPFLCVYQRQVEHRKLIVAHFAYTLVCLMLFVIHQFQLRYAVVAVVSVISLILMFPLHTLAFNLNVCSNHRMAEIGVFLLS